MIPDPEAAGLHLAFARRHREDAAFWRAQAAAADGIGLADLADRCVTHALRCRQQMRAAAKVWRRLTPAPLARRPAVGFPPAGILSR